MERDIIRLIVGLAICLGTGFVGSLLGGQVSSSWYESLPKPSFQPPGWIFGPVWTVLYILMGIAVFLVWRRGWAVKGVKIALLFFAIQLVLNGLWPIIFFRWNSLTGALIEIVFLWVAILATMVFFSRVSKTASVLLIPYILWVSFAIILTVKLCFPNQI
jgi:tryptophan-rich sensory protein